MFALTPDVAVDVSGCSLLFISTRKIASPDNVSSPIVPGYDVCEDIFPAVPGPQFRTRFGMPTIEDAEPPVAVVSAPDVLESEEPPAPSVIVAVQSIGTSTYKSAVAATPPFAYL